MLILIGVSSFPSSRITELLGSKSTLDAPKNGLIKQSGQRGQIHGARRLCLESRSSFEDPYSS
ncbi:hypothetical protein HZS_7761 [Henneguya salminicola]|nr:hypothetical protein HZS_7761 [Henneguya salminicola]